MINEHILPNPFKPKGDHLDNVLAAIEHDLAEHDEPLPTFLDHGFLERLQASVNQASPAYQSRGRRIIERLKAQLSD